MLLKGFGEVVQPRVITSSPEKEVGGFRSESHTLQNRQAGVGDWAGGQAWVDVGVVGRIDPKLVKA